MTHPDRRKTMWAQTPAAWLVPQSGAREGCVYPVPLASVHAGDGRGGTIGSADTDDLRLDGYVDVEPAHCRVGWKGTWFLINSSTGTTAIDGEPLAPAETRSLVDGAVIDLGAARLIFRSRLLAWTPGAAC